MRSFIVIFAIVTVVLCVASLVSAEGQKGDPQKDKAGKSASQNIKKADQKKVPPTTNKGTTSNQKDKNDKGTQKKKGDTGTDKQTKKGDTSKDKDGKKSGTTVPNQKKVNPGQYNFAKDQLEGSVNNGKIKLDSGQKTAMDKLLGGQQSLSSDDRQQLSSLLFKGSQSGLNSNDEAALSYLLTEEMARNQAQDTPPTPSNVKSSLMSIRVHNKTKEPIKLFLQVVASDPGQPPPDKVKLPDTLKYELQPGKAYDLLDKAKGKIMASTIRIWAQSPTDQWITNRDQDLPLTSTDGSKIYAVNFAPQTKNGGDLGKIPPKR